MEPQQGANSTSPCVVPIVTHDCDCAGLTDRHNFIVMRKNKIGKHCDEIMMHFLKALRFHCSNVRIYASGILFSAG